MEFRFFSSCAPEKVEECKENRFLCGLYMCSCVVLTLFCYYDALKSRQSDYASSNLASLRTNKSRQKTNAKSTNTDRILEKWWLFINRLPRWKKNNGFRVENVWHSCKTWRRYAARQPTTIEHKKKNSNENELHIAASM